MPCFGLHFDISYQFAGALFCQRREKTTLICHLDLQGENYYTYERCCASNCVNRIKYVDDATVMGFVRRLSPSYLNFTALDIFTFASFQGMVFFCLQYCPFPSASLLVSSSLIEKASCYKLLGVFSWNEHVTHIVNIVKKGSKRLYALRALTKCGLSDSQLILVFCSTISQVCLRIRVPRLGWPPSVSE